MQINIRLVAILEIGTRNWELNITKREHKKQNNQTTKNQNQKLRNTQFNMDSEVKRSVKDQ